MSETFDRIRGLVRADSIRVSRHAFRRMGQQDIVSDNLLSSMEGALVVEDYPDYFVGPSVLVLHFDREQRPIHAVWGLEKGTQGPAVLVTAYRPDPSLWSDDFRSRRS